MIIDDFDVPGFAISPYKADPPLIVDANAALASTIAVQRFETVPRGSTQIGKLFGCVDCKKLSAGSPLNLGGRSRTAYPAKIAAVCLSAKLLITAERNVQRYACQW